MKTTKIKIGFFVSVLSIIFIQCSSSYYYQKASPAAVNNAVLRYNEIQLSTFDGTFYKIKIHEMDSVFINGKGQFRKKNDSSWKLFSGLIPVDSLDLIQFRKKNFGQDLVIFGSTIAFLAYFLPGESGLDGISADIEHIGGGGSSCPFIYSWNREGYSLDAEAFGVAFGKALELTTWSILPNLKEDHSNLKVRITNERLETHYINSVELLSVESDPEATPVLDSKNQAWPTYHLISPLTALDNSNNDVLKTISAQDQNYCETDLSDISNSSDFEDVIDLTFVKHASASDGSLVIRAINTEFSETVFKKMFEFLGDQCLTFMRTAETDPETIDILTHWIEESSLKVFVWDGKAWVKQGRILPEANVASFSRIIRIHNPGSERDTLRVRLISLADVWKIDAANMDWTPVQPLTYKPVDLVSATGPSKKDIMPLLKENDDRYTVLVPQQQIDLTFQSPHSERNKKISYVLKTRGYLHEWFIQADDEDLSFSGFIPDDTKISYLKNLLQNKNLFLPLVYSEWKNSRIAMERNP